MANNNNNLTNLNILQRKDKFLYFYIKQSLINYNPRFHILIYILIKNNTSDLSQYSHFHIIYIFVNINFHYFIKYHTFSSIHISIHIYSFINR